MNVVSKWNGLGYAISKIERLGAVEVHPIRTFEATEPTDVLLCDPCYLFKNEGDDEIAWDDFCAIMFHNQFPFPGYVNGPNKDEGILHYKGAKIYYMGTAHGDGCYQVHYSGYKQGHECGVDAGMLCAVTVEDAKKLNPNIDNLGVILHQFRGYIDIDGEDGIMTGSHNHYPHRCKLVLDTDPSYCSCCDAELPYSQKDNWEQFCDDYCERRYYGEDDDEEDDW
jgi:hypothetical protein